MTSQLQLLKDKLPKLQAEFGADNPYVQGLKAQIARLEKPPADNPTGVGRPLQEALAAGMRSTPPTSKEPPETESDGIKAEALRRSQVRQLFKARPGQTRGSSK